MVVCAVIAAFNEEAHIAAVVQGAARYVSSVIVVDDGSIDATAAKARDAGAIVLRHDINMGKGCAIRIGLNHALQQPCSNILFLDADLQHDPAEIPLLLSRAAQGIGDFVLAEREFRRNTMPIVRFYSNVIGSAILSRLIGVEVADTQSGFRLVRAELLRNLKLTGTGYEIDTEILIKLIRAGATIDLVKVQRLQYAGASSKLRLFRDAVRTGMLAVGYRYLSA